jgi:hypothetical protein
MPMLTREALVKKLAAGEDVKGDRVRCVRETYGFVTKAQLAAAAEGAADLKKRAEDVTARAKERFGDELLGRVVPYVFATKGRKDDGLDLACKGCLTEEWDRAPMVLWGHNRWRPRIGDGMVTETSEDEVRGAVAFYPREFSEALDGGLSYALGEIAALRGHRGSIGFDIVAARLPDKKVLEMNPWALDVPEWAMREFSVVNFGMDSNSISAGRELGVDVQPIARALERFLDELAGETGMARAQLEAMWQAAADPARARVVAPAAEPALDAAAIKAALAAL